MSQTQPFQTFVLLGPADARSARIALRLSPGHRLGRQMRTSPRRAMASLDEDTVARLYLAAALASPDLPSLAIPKRDTAAVGFRLLGLSRIPESRNRLVKLRQTHHGVPVFGSLITIELSPANYLRALDGRLASPGEVEVVASIAPAAARARVAELAGLAPEKIERAPEPFVHYHEPSASWRLAYRFAGIAGRQERGEVGAHSFDYFIDAHSNELLDREPAAPSLVEQARDPSGGLEEIRTFVTAQGARLLVDDEALVATHDFGFQSLHTHAHELPGPLVRRREAGPWEPVAVAAQANAVRVARYLAEVHGRVGVDHRGAPYRQVVRCVELPGVREWRSARWAGSCAVYGQRQEGERFVSYAEDLAIVAHELFHGVVAAKPGLKAAGETGALNESYADLFAVFVVNRDNPNPRSWRWEIGSDGALAEGQRRDLGDPTRFGHPAHMNDFRRLDSADDAGGVHVNSSIHSHAGFLLLTAEDAQGNLLFGQNLGARLFYVALERLSPTSTFSDSRRAVVAAAQSLVPNDGLRSERLDAIDQAFDGVGISTG